MIPLEDALLFPIDIGQWIRYSDYTNQEQQRLQKESLAVLPVRNGNGPLCFIYTKYLAELNRTLESMHKQIEIQDTTTVFEDEVYYTAKIEGAKTTRLRTTELHNGAPIDKNDEYSERMTKNGFDAVRLLNLYGGRIDEEKMLQVWRVLTDGCRDNASVQGEKYRNGDVTVGSFEPPAASQIPGLMHIWLDFYNSSTLNEMPFIKAAILHIAFETIHPFCDGNGRLGRLLMNNYLIGQGIDSARAVSFSMQIDKTRNHYEAAFVDAENTMNDVTPFLSYMLDTMIEAYGTALEVQRQEQNRSDLDVVRSMERAWHNFMSLPKEERRQGILLNNKKVRVAYFDDVYLAECEKTGTMPDRQIYDHFWKNCVDLQEYEPQFCRRGIERN